MVNAQVLAIINIQLQPLLWLHVSRVLAIFSSFGDSFSSSSIQASYYDNQNNRGRDEKKQFRGNEGITLSTGLKCFRMWIQPVRVFTRFSQTFHEVEMPARSSVQEQHLREVVFRVEFVSTLSAPVYFRRCNLSSSSCLILPGICLSSSCLISPGICLL